MPMNYYPGVYEEKEETIMNDKQFEERINDLEQRLRQHEDMRSGAFDALSAVQDRMTRLQARMPTDMPPERRAMQEQGLLPKMAELMTRQTKLEEQFAELRVIAVEDHDAILEILEVLKSLGPRE
jgi:hypothetical protein